ncbi:hypothetical protein ACDW_09660 [Acidovorax sp. DW039]|uniref:DUF2917 domain-containing protein n=1 Tax=Acidovorax sp. DW039 TaxID=3095606 RepID=UPI00308BCD43|nr:hypothetical protein ACDW_09660 [Acidovorax sp. DW039]
MNTATLPTPQPPAARRSRSEPSTSALPLSPSRGAEHYTLQNTQAVQHIHVPARMAAVIQVEQGLVWLTCDGRLEDHFLAAGECTTLLGPARLRLSAEGPGVASFHCTLQSQRTVD